MNDENDSDIDAFIAEAQADKRDGPEVHIFTPEEEVYLNSLQFLPRQLITGSVEVIGRRNQRETEHGLKPLDGDVIEEEESERFEKTMELLADFDVNVSEEENE